MRTRMQSHSSGRFASNAVAGSPLISSGTDATPQVPITQTRPNLIYPLSSAGKGELKDILASRDIDYRDCCEKSHLVERVATSFPDFYLA